MRAIYRKTLRVLTDAVGVVLIIAAIFLGWLPGVGGIPLFLAGLGLLAINNDWAKRWLQYAKKHGSHLADTIFSKNPILMFVIDVISVGLFFLSSVIIFENTNYLIRTAAFAGITLSVMLFFGNRKRMQKIINKLQSRKKKTDNS